MSNAEQWKRMSRKQREDFIDRVFETLGDEEGGRWLNSLSNEELDALTPAEEGEPERAAQFPDTPSLFYFCLSCDEILAGEAERQEHDAAGHAAFGWVERPLDIESEPRGSEKGEGK